MPAMDPMDVDVVDIPLDDESLQEDLEDESPAEEREFNTEDAGLSQEAVQDILKRVEYDAAKPSLKDFHAHWDERDT